MQCVTVRCNVLQFCRVLQYFALSDFTKKVEGPLRRENVVVCCNVSQCAGMCAVLGAAVCCSVLQCQVLRERSSASEERECCRVLQCAAGCCSVLQCAAVCCSVLQCVAVCCSVLPRASIYAAIYAAMCAAVCAAACCSVCCSVLQCMLQCVLQCVAVSFSTKKAKRH